MEEVLQLLFLWEFSEPRQKQILGAILFLGGWVHAEFYVQDSFWEYFLVSILCCKTLFSTMQLALNLACSIFMMQRCTFPFFFLSNKATAKWFVLFWEFQNSQVSSKGGYHLLWGFCIAMVCWVGLWPIRNFGRTHPFERNVYPG